MMVSIQLTPWVLPDLLAVLVALREVLYLRPRRRERGVSALLVLVTSGGVWAALHAATVMSPSLGPQLALTRVGTLLPAIAVVAWVGFALSYSGRNRVARARVLAPLALALTVAVAAAYLGDHARWLYRAPALVSYGGVRGLAFSAGALLRVDLTVRIVAVGAGVVVLWKVSGGSSGTGMADRVRRHAAIVAAATVALAPMTALLVAPSVHVWTDLSAVGFVIASAMLTAGLLHGRLLYIGPVARKLVMEELRDPLVVFDARGRIVDANRAAEEVLGLQPYGNVPVPLGTLWAASGVAGSRARGGYAGARPAGTGKAPARRGQVALSTVEGGERTFEVTLSRLEEAGAPGRAVMLLRDVTRRDRIEQDLRATTSALRAANAELGHLANTDALTQLANRRHFMEILQQEVERAHRYARPVALIMVDLDHFKKVNDKYGHAQGDEVLRATADVLRGVCRDVDLAGRLGGEEFALLLPETDAEGARTVAERVRTRMEAMRHHARAASVAGETFGVTASLGVAALEPSATAEDVLRRADEVLYAAKAAGRNRVEVA